MSHELGTVLDGPFISPEQEVNADNVVGIVDDAHKQPNTTNSELSKQQLTEEILKKNEPNAPTDNKEKLESDPKKPCKRKSTETLENPNLKQRRQSLDFLSPSSDEESSLRSPNTRAKSGKIKVKTPAKAQEQTPNAIPNHMTTSNISRTFSPREIKDNMNTDDIIKVLPRLKKKRVLCESNQDGVKEGEKGREVTKDLKRSPRFKIRHEPEIGTILAHEFPTGLLIFDDTKTVRYLQVNKTRYVYKTDICATLLSPHISGSLFTSSNFTALLKSLKIQKRDLSHTNPQAFQQMPHEIQKYARYLIEEKDVRKIYTKFLAYLEKRKSGFLPGKIVRTPKVDETSKDALAENKDSALSTSKDSEKRKLDKVTEKEKQEHKSPKQVHRFDENNKADETMNQSSISMHGVKSVLLTLPTPAPAPDSKQSTNQNADTTISELVTSCREKSDENGAATKKNPCVVTTTVLVSAGVSKATSPEFRRTRSQLEAVKQHRDSLYQQLNSMTSQYEKIKKELKAAKKEKDLVQIKMQTEREGKLSGGEANFKKSIDNLEPDLDIGEDSAERPVCGNMEQTEKLNFNGVDGVTNVSQTPIGSGKDKQITATESTNENIVAAHTVDKTYSDPKQKLPQVVGPDEIVDSIADASCVAARKTDSPADIEEGQMEDEAPQSQMNQATSTQIPVANGVNTEKPVQSTKGTMTYAKDTQLSQDIFDKEKEAWYVEKQSLLCRLEAVTAERELARAQLDLCRSNGPELGMFSLFNQIVDLNNATHRELSQLRIDIFEEKNKQNQFLDTVKHCHTLLE